MPPALASQLANIFGTTPRITSSSTLDSTAASMIDKIISRAQVPKPRATQMTTQPPTSMSDLSTSYSNTNLRQSSQSVSRLPVSTSKRTSRPNPGPRRRQGSSATLNASSSTINATTRSTRVARSSSQPKSFKVVFGSTVHPKRHRPPSRSPPPLLPPPTTTRRPQSPGPSSSRRRASLSPHDLEYWSPSRPVLPASSSMGPITAQPPQTRASSEEPLVFVPKRYTTRPPAFSDHASRNRASQSPARRPPPHPVSSPFQPSPSPMKPPSRAEAMIQTSTFLQDDPPASPVRPVLSLEDAATDPMPMRKPQLSDAAVNTSHLRSSLVYHDPPGSSWVDQPLPPSRFPSQPPPSSTQGSGPESELASVFTSWLSGYLASAVTIPGGGAALDQSTTDALSQATVLQAFMDTGVPFQQDIVSTLAEQVIQEEISRHMAEAAAQSAAQSAADSAAAAAESAMEAEIRSRVAAAKAEIMASLPPPPPPPQQELQQQQQQVSGGTAQPTVIQVAAPASPQGPVPSTTAFITSTDRGVQSTHFPSPPPSPEPQHVEEDQDPDPDPEPAPLPPVVLDQRAPSPPRATPSEVMAFFRASDGGVVSTSIPPPPPSPPPAPVPQPQASLVPDNMSSSRRSTSKSRGNRRPPSRSSFPSVIPSAEPLPPHPAAAPLSDSSLSPPPAQTANPQNQAQAALSDGELDLGLFSEGELMSNDHQQRLFRHFGLLGTQSVLAGAPELPSDSDESPGTLQPTRRPGTAASTLPQGTRRYGKSSPAALEKGEVATVVGGGGSAPPTILSEGESPPPVGTPPGAVSNVQSGNTGSPQNVSPRSPGVLGSYVVDATATPSAHSGLPQFPSPGDSSSGEELLPM